MARRGAAPLDADLIQGTLDLLILQTLAPGPAHGHSIAQVIEHRSDSVLQVEHGSLYPALHRLEDRGRLTVSGRRQLSRQAGRWRQLVRAIARVLQPAEE